MWNMKRLNEILGIKYSLIQGGMAQIATGGFAADCSNAGALGVIGSGGMNADGLRKEIRDCKYKTNKPFAVNLVMNHRELEKLIKIVIEEKVPIVTLGNGDASKWIPKLKENGIFVMSVVGIPIFAKYAERAGADAIIAEGSESGGHIGMMTTMTLVPQIRDMTSIPVIAAGGIGDYRQYNAALMLGACGVQVGTALLCSQECPIHENYKNILVKSRSFDSVVVGNATGDLVRLIRNNMVKEYLRIEKEGADKKELDNLTLGGLAKAAIEGDIHNGSVMAGLVCGQIKRIRTLAEIFEDICKEVRYEKM